MSTGSTRPRGRSLLRARREISLLLVVLTMRPIVGPDGRPRGQPPRRGRRRYTWDRLSAEDALALVSERTGATRITEPVAAIVRERAEGNPLFIEQLTYAMRDAGQIVVDNGQVRWPRVSGTSRPRSPPTPSSA